MEQVKGYKVFNSDWTCSPMADVTKQYTCPGKFEEEGELRICKHGMHFCEDVADCFNYYKFNSNNKVAEVIAYGTVLREGDKCCTDKLEIVREVSWEELLRMVNTGKDCTGFCNTGNNNSGNHNTGHHNTGDCNTGSYNTGHRNTGDYNTGDWNTGNRNTGDSNIGYRNFGNGNIGDSNTGDHNIGDNNIGSNNTGKMNTGDRNTGSRNIGDRNTGDWNICDHSTGCFCTKEQPIMMFDKPSSWTYSDWVYSEARCLLSQIPKNVTEWVFSSDMTDKEKKRYPEHKTIGGYLKILDESECAQKWWNELSDDNKSIIKAIPNFDPVIFEDITGIKVD